VPSLVKGSCKGSTGLSPTSVRESSWLSRTQDKKRRREREELL
jgi:hypothetical protein